VCEGIARIVCNRIFGKKAGYCDFIFIEDGLCGFGVEISNFFFDLLFRIAGNLCSGVCGRKT